MKYGIVPLLLGCLAIAGCGGGPDHGAEKAKLQAVEHPDAEYLVQYGGSSFRVNVRYVPLIDESVIAVREGRGEAVDEEWPILNVSAPEKFNRVTNFADDRYRDFVIDIAGAVQEMGGICSDGSSIKMSTNSDGEVRTLYRSNRQVWVVFALCPEQVRG
ncbi:MAG: hypothetical protein AAF698_04375 [Pseudomonadota bacterium]